MALVPLAKDKQSFWAVNRDGTRNLLQASLDAGVRKVVHTSSSAVFGIPETNPVTEDMVPTLDWLGYVTIFGYYTPREVVREGLRLTPILALLGTGLGCAGVGLWAFRRKQLTF